MMFINMENNRHKFIGLNSKNLPKYKVKKLLSINKLLIYKGG